MWLALQFTVPTDLYLSWGVLVPLGWLRFLGDWIGFLLVFLFGYGFVCFDGCFSAEILCHIGLLVRCFVDVSLLQTWSFCF